MTTPYSYPGSRCCESTPESVPLDGNHHVKLVSKPREDERLAEDIRRPAKANYVTNYTLSRHKEEQSEGLLNSFSIVGKFLFFCCVRPVVILLSLAL